MKKKSMVMFGVSVLSVIVFAGCASSPKDSTGKVQNELSNAPTWVKDPGALGAYGSAKVGKLGMEFARTEALASARRHLAVSMSTKVKALVKRFEQATGLGDQETQDRVSEQTSRELGNITLNGARQKDIWISPSGDVYAYVVIDESVAKDSIKNAVSTSYKNDQALWQQFQAKKANEELDKEIDKEFGNFKQQ